MLDTFIPHLESGLLSKLMQDYLSGTPEVVKFTSGIPNEASLLAQKDRLAQCYTNERRRLLVDALRRQNPDLSPLESQHLDELAAGALTITTGHQLMVCGGTAFFEIKILGAVALARHLSALWNTPVVPVFWMASEDHDFEEIRAVQIGGKKFVWEQEGTGGPVGRLPVDGLAEQLRAWLPTQELNKAQRTLIESRVKAYESAQNLAEATRAWVRDWASAYGVLVIDGDDPLLKESMQPIWQRELQGEFAELIHHQTEKMRDAGCSIQVHPREINLFSLRNGQRTRIIDPAKAPSEAVEISPNALLRPVYQEWVLPNLAYVGGGGELAYWLQIQPVFEALHLSMPVLYLRDSVLPITAAGRRAIDRLSISAADILKTSKEALIKEKLGYHKGLKDQTAELAKPLHQAVQGWGEALVEEFPELYAHAEALKVKMMKLNQRTIETRYRALKRRETDLLQAIDRVYDMVFPKGVFWERKASYIDLVGLLGVDIQDELVEKMSTINAGVHLVSAEK